MKRIFAYSLILFATIGCGATRDANGARGTNAEEEKIPDNVVALINEWRALSDEEVKADIHLSEDPSYRAYTAWMSNLGRLTASLDQGQPIYELTQQVFRVAQQYEDAFVKSMEGAGFDPETRSYMVDWGKYQVYMAMEDYKEMRVQFNALQKRVQTLQEDG